MQPHSQLEGGPGASPPPWNFAPSSPVWGSPALFSRRIPPPPPVIEDFGSQLNSNCQKMSGSDLEVEGGGGRRSYKNQDLLLPGARISSSFPFFLLEHIPTWLVLRHIQGGMSGHSIKFRVYICDTVPRCPYPPFSWGG